MKYSIILPCYNVENLIGLCLNSLLCQDIPESEYEIICVNDCSPDNTFDVVKRYQQEHSNIVIIEHTINKRQGGARNTGLNIARGEYIWFVDPDDTIKPGILAELYQICKVNDLDTLLFNFDKVDSLNEYISTSTFSSDSSVYNGVDYVKNVWGINFLNNYDASIWNRTYKRTFLIDKSIFFPENMYWEDFDHSLKTILYAERIMSVSTAFYNYRINPSSVMNTLKNNVNMIALFDSTIRLGGMLVDFSSEVEMIDKQIAENIKIGGVWRINQFTRQLIRTDWTYKKQFIRIVRNNRAVIKQEFFNSRNKYIITYPVSILFLQFILLLKRIYK